MASNELLSVCEVFKNVFFEIWRDAVTSLPIAKKAPDAPKRGTSSKS